MLRHISPQLLAIFSELSSACAAYVSTYMSDIAHTIKIIIMMIK